MNLHVSFFAYLQSSPVMSSSAAATALTCCHCKTPDFYSLPPPYDMDPHSPVTRPTCPLPALIEHLCCSPSPHAYQRVNSSRAFRYAGLSISRRQSSTTFPSLAPLILFTFYPSPSPFLINSFKTVPSFGVCYWVLKSLVSS